MFWLIKRTNKLAIHLGYTFGPIVCALYMHFLAAKRRNATNIIVCRKALRPVSSRPGVTRTATSRSTWKPKATAAANSVRSRLFWLPIIARIVLYGVIKTLSPLTAGSVSVCHFSLLFDVLFLWFLQRDATQSAVLLRQVVRLSVCLSVRNVEVSWSHRLKFFRRQFHC